MFTKITVIGLGYVGLGQALLFNESHDVIGFDISDEKLAAITAGHNLWNDENIAAALKRKPLIVTNNFKTAVLGRDLIIIATPTNFNDDEKAFDLHSVLETLKKLSKLQVTAPIVIKSTLHVGATTLLQERFPTLNIFFSPEFLREGKSLFDNYYPSRIIVGYKLSSKADHETAKEISELYQNTARTKDIATLLVGTNEAEAIKLFANTYLALRVAFFNELDTYALTKGLNAEEIIHGVSLDPRIGNFYNNPSFGYGGYCLPKDTRELHQSFKLVPENLISATLVANKTRQNFIAEWIKNELKQSGPNAVLGVYRLTMKKDATNMRESSIIKVVEILHNTHVKMVIYEPLFTGDNYNGIPVVTDLKMFKTQTNLIIANRYHPDLNDVKAKVFTRDLFNSD